MKSVRGFTLVEVLVALLILAGTVIVLYHVWSTSLLAVRKFRNDNTIALLLQKKMVEFETEHKNDGVDALPDNEKGDFGDDYPDYSWEVKTKPFELPPLPAPKNVQNQQTDVSHLITTAMTDYFHQAVREVQVTVIYKRGKKPLRFSISSIKIDYSKELPSGF